MASPAVAVRPMSCQRPPKSTPCVLRCSWTPLLVWQLESSSPLSELPLAFEGVLPPMTACGWGNTRSLIGYHLGSFLKIVIIRDAANVRGVKSPSACLAALNTSGTTDDRERFRRRCEARLPRPGMRLPRSGGGPCPRTTTLSTRAPGAMTGSSGSAGSQMRRAASSTSVSTMMATCSGSTTRTGCSRTSPTKSSASWV